MRDTIKKLLDSNLSSNSIATQTGVSQAVISKIRNGKRDLGGISLNTAEKLYNYQKEIEKMNKVEKIREALESEEKGYYVEEYKNIQELIEFFKENDDEEFDIEDLKRKSSLKEPEIKYNVGLVTYDNPNTNLFEWAYLDEDVEDIINHLRV
ncbi:hypothetical protein ACS7WQ_06370 [Staphylococcus felis]|uniref:hypothetical protein n=1 Tax=Staphylococcus felis TaxID=46127 RepID=UPI003F41FD01